MPDHKSLIGLSDLGHFMQHMPHFQKLWTASVSYGGGYSYQHWSNWFQWGLVCLNTARLWIFLRITNCFWTASKTSMFIANK